jgi:predicted O-methyltransferase YrrM
MLALGMEKVKYKNRMRILPILEYTLSALRHNGLRPRRLARFCYNALKVASDNFFMGYDPHFKIVDWEKIANEREQLIILMPGGGSNTYEHACLACIVKWIAPKTILEIGTYLGATTRVLFLNSGADTEIYTVDLPGDYVPTANITDKALAQRSIELARSGSDRPYLPRSPRVHLRLGDSVTLNWREVVEGKPVDLILIDGSHSAFYAIHDTRKALEVLSQRGAIVWHDAWYRDYGYYSDGYRVHEAIRAVLSTTQQSHVFRMRGTEYAVYWPELSRMIS